MKQSIQEKGLFKCDQCPKAFVTRKQLKRHNKIYKELILECAEVETVQDFKQILKGKKIASDELDNKTEQEIKPEKEIKTEKVESIEKQLSNIAKAINEEWKKRNTQSPFEIEQYNLLHAILSKIISLYFVQ